VAWLPQVRGGKRGRRLDLLPGRLAGSGAVAGMGIGPVSEALARAQMRPGYTHHRSLFFMVIFPYSDPLRSSGQRPVSRPEGDSTRGPPGMQQVRIGNCRESSHGGMTVTDWTHIPQQRWIEAPTTAGSVRYGDPQTRTAAPGQGPRSHHSVTSDCRGRFSRWLKSALPQARARTRLVRRDIFRAAVFLWTMPLLTPRANSGCAAFSAASASALLPPAIAISAFFTADLRRLLLARLRAVRTTVWRMRFSADLW
jgi:hypothetical protein